MLSGVKAKPAAFYYTGGTVPPGAPSYVARAADQELLEALQQDEYAYVLTSRQMGKSSLMVRVAHKMRESGSCVAVVDLSAIGQNVTPTQWYRAIALRIGRELEIEDAVVAAWDQNASDGPLDRLMRIIEEVCLGGCSGRLVIFIDEIDIVRSLPFRADEFFAAIRACYNRRTDEPEWTALTFCLLGVATPSQLIQDPRMTPFNIGHRIELTDFTPAEALPLSHGLCCPQHQSLEILDRILYWTGGHPYLTQRLCKAVADHAGPCSARTIDDLCGLLFLSAGAKVRDNNLLFVRDRLLRSESDVAGILDLYGRVLKGDRVRDDPTDPLISQLMLAGTVRRTGFILCARNRLYATAFDRAWVRANYPDAERRRQRAAYLRGASVAVALATLIVSVIGLLLVRSIRAERHALAATKTARTERDRAREALYFADLDLAQRALDSNDSGRVIALLDACRPGPRERDLRGFEWYYLRRAADTASRVLSVGVPVAAVGYTRGNERIVCAGADGSITSWGASGTNSRSIAGTRPGPLFGAALSPDAERIAIGTRQMGQVEIENTKNGIRTSVRFPSTNCVADASFASGQNGIIAAMFDGSVWESNSPPGKPARLLGSSGEYLTAFAASQDRCWVAVAIRMRGARVLNRRTGRQYPLVLPPNCRVESLAYSPSNALAAGLDDGTVRIFLPGSHAPAVLGSGLPGRPRCLAFSPSGRRLAVGTDQAIVAIIDTASGRAGKILRGHRDRVLSLAFAEGERSLISGSADGTARVWDLSRSSDTVRLPTSHAGLFDGKIADDGHLIAVWEARALRVWRQTAGHLNLMLSVPEAGFPLALSADGNWLISTQGMNHPGIWSLAPCRRSCELHASGVAEATAALSAAAGLAATGGSNGMVRLHDLHSGVVVRQFATKGMITCLAFSPDGKRIAGAGAGEVTVWSPVQPEPLLRIRGARCPVTCMVFSPDSKLLASVGANRVITMWDVAGGGERWSAAGPAGELYALAFSPDGRTLATGGRDRSVRLWSTLTGSEVGCLRGHRADICALAFSPDGSELRSLDQSGTLMAWSGAR
jgi:WD40 repeat protein